ncbi:MAG: DegT/DnrJ/EryC1/StrS family aminotransferase [Nanoarchaeota archaeon]|nr:MAG: DegT/DnrJ/EryC1/StrS family aminotransferase [Nanoarchaeota archaeon]
MIPLMKPTLPGYEKVEADIKEIFRTGMITNGKFVAEFEKKSAKYLGVKHCVATASASLGLMVAMSRLKPGSDVIMPGYTFSATYQALLWNNLNAVFVDCDDYCNIDPTQVEKAITPNTAAILGVHMFGNPCDAQKLESIAKKQKIELYIDAAHAFGATTYGKKVGGFGSAEIFSLGPTKTLPVGEGCIISTNSEEVANDIRLRCNHGQKVHGNMDSALKSVNGRLEEINAAIGIHILDEIDQHIEQRNVLAERYNGQLKKISGIEVCMAPKHNRSTYKDFAIFIDKEKFGCDREVLMRKLLEEGIQTRRYFHPPAHQLEINKDLFKNVHLPVTEKKSSTTLSLPMYSHMPGEEVDAVISAIKRVHDSN